MSVSEGDAAKPEASSQDSTSAPSASISSRGQAMRMSHAMQDSVSQRSFYRNKGMYYIANKSILSNPAEAEVQFIRDHEEHSSFQERLCHPLVFHAEMMGDIIYFHKVLQHSDAEEIVKT